ncbi:MAG TPA: DUF5615 family PIN-like protein [Anaerolineae bacterium]|nr:DUF5615 family PIN-like protein [Anaerolineae bacterium]HQJ51218.1 DUF5615 family PIN-like protein [Anaerolineae bacterium]
MTRPRLHLDADTSRRSLHRALLELGHDVTRTPNEWAPAAATDEEQLLAATARGRCLFTFNVRDFQALALLHPGHSGIVLAFQGSWTVPELIRALDRLLSTTTAEDWSGTVRWLNDWR